MGGRGVDRSLIILMSTCVRVYLHLRSCRRAAPPLVWPRSLVDRPKCSKPLVLDLNQWIYLAKASTGPPIARKHLDILEWCRHARARGSLLFPPADSHYVEMATIKDPSQRQALANLREELSGFSTLLSRPCASTHSPGLAQPVRRSLDSSPSCWPPGAHRRVTSSHHGQRKRCKETPARSPTAAPL